MPAPTPSSSAIPNAAQNHGETNADGASQGACGAARRSPRHRLHRRDARRARCRQDARDVVGAQLDGSLPDGSGDFVIAYEPVWAIGTGVTPTAGDVGDMHGFIRERLLARFGTAGRGMRILYGGSVKPANAKELLGIDNVDGALVGGASLKADEFLAIAAAYR